MTPYETSSSVVALLAALISIIALYLNRRTARQWTEPQRRLVAIEDERERERLLEQRRARPDDRYAEQSIGLTNEPQATLCPTEPRR